MDRARKVKIHVLCSVIIFTSCITLVSCSSDEPISSIEEQHTEDPQPSSDMADIGEQEEIEQEFMLSSQSFKEGDAIPSRYTCKGEDMSPHLAWSGTPAGTESFALIVDDPDAPGGVFTHWVVFNIPSNTNELKEGAGNNPSPAGGALHGKNDMKKDLYGGPCPPPGSPHHYRFTLYALDTTLELAEGVSRQQVLEVIEGHVIDQSTLNGTFKR